MTLTPPVPSQALTSLSIPSEMPPFTNSAQPLSIMTVAPSFALSRLEAVSEVSDAVPFVTVRSPKRSENDSAKYGRNWPPCRLPSRRNVARRSNPKCRQVCRPRGIGFRSRGRRS